MSWKGGISDALHFARPQWLPLPNLSPKAIIHEVKISTIQYI